MNLHAFDLENNPVVVSVRRRPLRRGGNRKVSCIKANRAELRIIQSYPDLLLSNDVATAAALRSRSRELETFFSEI
jgi:fructose-1-phosphate kinase PfkB-like protein